MSDGRDVINQTYKAVKEISTNMEAVRSKFSDQEFESFKIEITECVTWAKKCRNKVWLRSKEGTDLAQGCLNAVEAIETEIQNGAEGLQAAETAKFKLESLAKVISTKASVMT